MQGLPSLSLSLLLKRERKSLKFTLTFMQEQGLSFVGHTLPYIPFHAGTGLLLYRNYPAPFQAGAPPFRQGLRLKEERPTSSVFGPASESEALYASNPIYSRD